MKLPINALLLLICLALFAFAAEQPQRQVIVSYPKGTPNTILEEAIKAIKEAGGVVTHEYNLIMAFAAKVPTKALESVQAMGAQHNVVIEEDQTMSINDS